MGAAPLWDKRQVASMLRLARTLHSTPATSARRRRALLRSVCELTGATAGCAWPDVRLASDGPAPSDVNRPHDFVVTALGDRAVDAPLASHLIDGPAADPALHRLLRRTHDKPAGATLTRTRRQLIRDDHRWYASEHVSRVRKPLGVDDAVYSAHVLAPARAAVLCVYRPWGHGAPFGESKCHLVDLLHHECAWVYLPAGAEGDPHPRPGVDALPLSPRAKQTLFRLLAGRGEKQIAADMRLSVNTVHHYVKAIYRHFDVSSRAELLALWMDREP